MINDRPEYYLITPEYNSEGRLCNHGSGNECPVKVPAEEWERFSQLAGRQHEIIDGVVFFNADLEPALPDEVVIQEYKEARQRLKELLADEQIDNLCGFAAINPQGYSLSEKELLIEKIKALKEKISKLEP